MIKLDLNEIDFLLASMDKIQIPASASPKIADFLNKLLKEKVPERWFILDEIPKSDRGKINRDIVASICLKK